MKISDLILLQQIVDITRNLKVNKCEFFFSFSIFVFRKYNFSLSSMANEPEADEIEQVC